MKKQKKLAILMAGSSSAGKSTTSKTFAEGEPNECSQELEVTSKKGVITSKVLWTIYDNCALAGNHHAGTDANKVIGSHRVAFEKCLSVRDIAILDGKINSPQWVEAVNDACELYDMELLLLYFDIPAEELLTRLAKRRQVDKEDIREKMHPTCVMWRNRDKVLVRNVEKLSKVDWWQLDIGVGMSPEEIVDEMDKIVDKIFGDRDD